ncbi:hypothetical protein M2263_000180 [Providencia alcalifaciens]|nr:hypothetical protein [Providencia alcalifaciens]
MVTNNFEKIKAFIDKKLSAYNINFIEDHQMLTFDFEGSMEELSDKLSPEIILIPKKNKFLSFQSKRTASLEWMSEKYGISTTYIEPNRVMVIVTVW